jgi:hypothetical protein
MWEGWIEFVPSDGGGDVLVTPVESRQPERQHLVYWATGLSQVYYGRCPATRTKSQSRFAFR